jgi:hypothetical protein
MTLPGPHYTVRAACPKCRRVVCLVCNRGAQLVERDVAGERRQAVEAVYLCPACGWRHVRRWPAERPYVSAQLREAHR